MTLVEDVAKSGHGKHLVVVPPVATGVEVLDDHAHSKGSLR